MIAKILDYIKQSFLIEFNRWVVWLPVLLGMGIVSYLSLSFEPSLIDSISSLCTGFIFVLFSWKRQSLRYLALGIFIFLLGFASAKLRAEMVDAPVIQQEMKVTVSGNVEEISYSRNFPRLVLRNLRIDELAKEELPEKIRITVRTKFPGEIVPGDRVIVNAILLPPPRPVMPRGYDFQRWAFFEQIGATGYAISKVTKLKWGHEENFVEELRHNITEYILKNVEGQGGAVAAALITGDRSRISEETKEQMRDAGLAHLLAISGLHISLVSAFFFFSIRFCINLIGSERFSSKKLAAVISIIGSFVYLVISGMPISAQRAFLMIFLVLLAVLLDRSPTPMRSVAFAAFVILLITPESIVHAGFQMSFMAVICLIAMYEAVTRNFPGFFNLQTENQNLKNYTRILVYPISIMMTTTFAGLATAPFAAYHFNRYAAYGLLGNLAAIPLMSFLVMPMAVIAGLLYPFGMADECLQIMGWGIELIIEIAKFVSGLEGAAGNIKSFSVTSLCIISFGMLWIFLWQTKWRLLGFIPLVIGVYIATQTQKPIFMMSENGKLWAMEIDDKLHLKNRRKTFTSDQWVSSYGQEEFLRIPKELRENPPEIKEKITSDMLESNGTHVVYEEDGNILIQNVGQYVGDRMWAK